MAAQPARDPVVLKPEGRAQPLAGTFDTGTASEPDGEDASQDLAHGLPEGKGRMGRHMGQVQVAEERDLADAGERQPQRREEEADGRQEDHQVGAAPQTGDLRFQATKPQQGSRHEKADEGTQGHHHEHQATGVGQQPQLVEPFRK